MTKDNLCAPQTEGAGWHYVHIPTIKGMGYGDAIPLWWNNCGWEHPLIDMFYNGKDEFKALYDCLEPEDATKMGWIYRGPCEIGLPPKKIDV